jgi:hypothetical protein
MESVVMDLFDLLLLAGAGWLVLALLVHALIIYPLLRRGSDHIR